MVGASLRVSWSKLLPMAASVLAELSNYYRDCMAFTECLLTPELLQYDKTNFVDKEEHALGT